MFLIVAISKNFVIGKNNTIPWHLSEDLKRFRDITTNCTVVMGRKTYESLGKPLKNRFNIVITSDFEKLNTLNKDSNLIFVNNIKDSINIAKSMEKEIAIIGGYNIYKEFLKENLIKKIYLTILDKEIIGDTFFPNEYLKNFKEISSEEKLDEKEGKFFFKELLYF